MLGVVVPALLVPAVVAADLCGVIAVLDVCCCCGRIDLVAVEIVLAVDVDVDVVATPVAVAPDGATDDYARGERPERRAVVVSRWVIGVGRVMGYAQAPYTTVGLYVGT